MHRGGTLYISGDISYDSDRKRTKTSRLEELAGIKVAGQRYPDVRFESAAKQEVRYDDGIAYTGCPALSFEPTAATVIAVAEHKPVAVLHRFGKGKVFFSADPAEFNEAAPLGAIYLRAANEAEVRPEAVTPDLKDIQVFRIPCERWRGDDGRQRRPDNGEGLGICRRARLHRHRRCEPAGDAGDGRRQARGA